MFLCLVSQVVAVQAWTGMSATGSGRSVVWGHGTRSGLGPGLYLIHIRLCETESGGGSIKYDLSVDGQRPERGVGPRDEVGFGPRCVLESYSCVFEWSFADGGGVGVNKHKGQAVAEFMSSTKSVMVSPELGVGPRDEVALGGWRSQEKGCCRRGARVHACAYHELHYQQ
jgi:hypothetical protein